MDKYSPIGFFDSGLGGISVLKEAAKLLPNENFIYFGDSANAPYGSRTSEDVRLLTNSAVKHLIAKDVKAIVIACNTATSAGIDWLRKIYPDMIIIGVEPALKPAVELFPHGKILVMATEMTLSETKFHNLRTSYEKKAEIIPVPCSGLMEFVENGVTSGAELNSYLHRKLDDFLNTPIDAIVLGCTHYPFLKDAICEIVGPKTKIIDGGVGTSKQLIRRLESADLLNSSIEKGIVSFYNSSHDDDLIDLSKKLFYI